MKAKTTDGLGGGNGPLLTAPAPAQLSDTAFQAYKADKWPPVKGTASRYFQPLPVLSRV